MDLVENVLIVIFFTGESNFPEHSVAVLLLLQFCMHLFQVIYHFLQQSLLFDFYFHLFDSGSV